MSLPLNLPKLQQDTQWKTQLDPVLALPPVQGRFIFNIPITNGDNVINTGLNKLQQGWIVVDQNQANVQLYRNAPFNTKTLTLNAVVISGNPSISLWVF